MDPLQPITAADATARGYTSLTAPFSRNEGHLLQSALSSLSTASIVLVVVPGGTEIWRASSEIISVREGQTKSLVSVRAGGGI